MGRLLVGTESALIRLVRIDCREKHVVKTALRQCSRDGSFALFVVVIAGG